MLSGVSFAMVQDRGSTTRRSWFEKCVPPRQFFNLPRYCIEPLMGAS